MSPPTSPARPPASVLAPMRRMPAHLVNGASVALGVGLVQLLFALLAGPHTAAFAAGGALCTSLSDTPNTVRRNWHRAAGAALLTSVATLVFALVKPYPAPLVGLVIGLISFGAMMTMAWGARAGPVSFAPVLALLFEMAAPRTAHAQLQPVLWTSLGSVAYVGWAALTAALLQRRYRSLALDAALRAASRLLCSRATVLDADASALDANPAMSAWIGDEATLAERLQAARDLLFAAPDTPRARRETAALLHTIELRDTLLASRLDLDLRATDALGRRLREQVAANLRQIAALLDDARALHAAVGGGWTTPPARPALPVIEGPSDAAPDDTRLRLAPALNTRMQRLADDAQRVRELLAGADETIAVPRDELRLFVAPVSWPLSALRAQLHRRSPVLRHALRAALAFTCAYFVGQALPWSSHSHWLVLSVAVVLRGNLEQTLARRNARVAGTVIGCLIVVLLTRIHSDALMGLAFLAAVGIAHSFVLVRYLVTAAAASVMALLAAHEVNPAIGFAVGERLADTLLGALLAWAFSYVLPSWERRGVPGSVARAMQALADYARLSLAADGRSGVQQRLARLKAYDALGLVAAAVQRSGVEPAHVRLPAVELLQLLDHAYRLMAHLSIVRLTLGRRAADLDWDRIRQPLAEAEAALAGYLATASPATPMAPRPPATGGPPSRSPQVDPTAWFLRRLQLSLHDAGIIHASAQAALRALAS